MEKPPMVGDRVKVPFGLHILEGEVVRVSDPALGPRVTVAVEIDGGEETLDCTYQLEYIEKTAAA